MRYIHIYMMYTLLYIGTYVCVCVRVYVLKFQPGLFLFFVTYFRLSVLRQYFIRGNDPYGFNRSNISSSFNYKLLQILVPLKDSLSQRETYLFLSTESCLPSQTK